jgi:CRISPR-associated protein Cmr4
MYKCVKPIFFRAMSGIHAGTGSDLGLVDLPIQRERHSGLPKIESSGVKGCIREEFEQIEGLPKDFVEVAFGPADDGGKHSGSVAFSDARLLLFPVRSAKGVFAYATCPYILSRLVEDMSLADITVPAFANNNKAQVSGKGLVLSGGKIILEEFTIEVEETEYAKSLAKLLVTWLKLEGNQAKLVQENLVILSDDDFKDFAENNTEIITRIKIDPKTGTVAKGALFTEELLPTETVLYSLVMASKIFLPSKPSDEKKVKKGVVYREDSETVGKADSTEAAYLVNTIKGAMPKYVQLGGDATIGKGLCRVTMGGDAQ